MRSGILVTSDIFHKVMFSRMDDVFYSVPNKTKLVIDRIDLQLSVQIIKEIQHELLNRHMLIKYPGSFYI